MPFPRSQDLADLERLSQQFMAMLLYGNPDESPTQFTGLAPFYSPERGSLRLTPSFITDWTICRLLANYRVSSTLAPFYSPEAACPS